MPLPPDIDGDGFVDRYEYVDCYSNDAVFDFDGLDYMAAITPKVRQTPVQQSGRTHSPVGGDNPGEPSAQRTNAEDEARSL